MFVTGIVKEDERSKFGYELDITDIEVIGESQDYPITPKEHGTDFLMTTATCGCVHANKSLSCKSVMPLSMQLMSSLIRMVHKI